MQTQPLVTVVVPTRNRSATVIRCVESLIAQSYRPYEIIIVDDGSTDRTPTVLEALCSINPDCAVRTVRNSVQIGANPSRNRGIRESNGAYVAFVDDDIIAAPEWLDRLMAGFVNDRVAAVTGRVDNVPPRNLFELTLKGTHRVHGRLFASRLVGGNMCVRRELLERFGWDEDRAAINGDTTVSGRGDEDGLFQSLRAAGFEQRVVHDARVIHDHPYRASTFFRQAYRSGKATARLAAKYRLPPRWELLALLLAYLNLPLALVILTGWLKPTAAIAAAGCASLFLAAIVYNDLFRKHKTLLEVFASFPLLVAYYHVRLAGYIVQWFERWVGTDRRSGD